MNTEITYALIKSFNILKEPIEIMIPVNYSDTVINFIKDYKNVFKNKKDILEIVLRLEFLTKKEMILFSIQCCRRLTFLNSEESISSLDLLERFCDGEKITVKEFLYFLERLCAGEKITVKELMEKEAIMHYVRNGASNEIYRVIEEDHIANGGSCYDELYLASEAAGVEDAEFLSIDAAYKTVAFINTLMIEEGVGYFPLYKNAHEVANTVAFAKAAEVASYWDARKEHETVSDNETEKQIKILLEILEKR